MPRDQDVLLREVAWDRAFGATSQDKPLVSAWLEGLDISDEQLREIADGNLYNARYHFVLGEQAMDARPIPPSREEAMQDLGFISIPTWHQIVDVNTLDPPVLRYWARHIPSSIGATLMHNIAYMWDTFPMLHKYSATGWVFRLSDIEPMGASPIPPSREEAMQAFGRISRIAWSEIEDMNRSDCPVRYWAIPPSVSPGSSQASTMDIARIVLHLTEARMRNYLSLLLSDATNKGDDPDRECPICLVVVKDGQKYTPCCGRHRFHAACISKSLNQDARCPMCRTHCDEWSKRTPQGEHRAASHDP